MFTLAPYLVLGPGGVSGAPQYLSHTPSTRANAHAPAMDVFLSLGGFTKNPHHMGAALDCAQSAPLLQRGWRHGVAVTGAKKPC